MRWQQPAATNPEAADWKLITDDWLFPGEAREVRCLFFYFSRQLTKTFNSEASPGNDI
jgi:hypothetical protein